MIKAKTVEIITVRNILEYITEIEKSDSLLWFRGHGKSEKYDLRPTLYRMSDGKTYQEINNIEYDMIKQFKFRSIPFVGDRSADKALDTLFFMQHYGIPTRLLDWSESPMVALYFALHDPANYDPKTGFIEDCAVWILDPIEWNNSVARFGSRVGILSYPQDKVINGYLPITERDSQESRHSNPVALEGRHNSPRIVAQRGTFMIFGTDLESLEKIYLKSDIPEGCLKKIIIPKTEITSMRMSLYKMGVTDSAVYPDLQGLATEIKRQLIV